MALLVYLIKCIPTGDSEDKLHPSWAAKKKQKEMMSKIPQFQGKKTKFD